MKTQIFLMYIVTILFLTFQLFPDLFVRIKPLLLNETGDVMVNGKVTNKTDIIKIVWQTLRRSTYEIFGVKLLMKGYIWYRFHCLQKKLWSKFCRKNIGGYLPSCRENQQHIEDQRNVFPTSQDVWKQLLAKFHPWNVSK